MSSKELRMPSYGGQAVIEGCSDAWKERIILSYAQSGWQNCRLFREIARSL